ncbi:MAG: DUF4147 domain-containing protein [Planctomycetales bacterium]|nr:DUF4147 domain-containing protein [Planctomycetales bacterium]
MLAQQARQIWNAGLDAVRSKRLMLENVAVESSDSETMLCIDEQRYSADSIRNICVVGAGKAGAGMAAGFEEALGPKWLQRWNVHGWINVPRGCEHEPLQCIQLHAARPAGRNEPTAAGVQGARQILDLLRHLHPDDLCLGLWSGGGSALLPLPVDGVSLEQKTAATRYLSAVGASIQQLNAVRTAISQVKGGGVAKACRAKRLHSLIVSDVIGDPLDVIASGPTVVEPLRTKAASFAPVAFEVLRQFDPQRKQIADAIWRHVEQRSHASITDSGRPESIVNSIIGNNQTAVDAAVAAAETLGFVVSRFASESSSTTAEEVAVTIADWMQQQLSLVPAEKACLVWGGEPVVRLAPAERRGVGGRNQQVALKVLSELSSRSISVQRIAVVSGGTDGEDGPTTAAGAMVDASVYQQAADLHLDADDFLSRNDAYSFFAQIGGLLVTGPTHTNVCDLRIAIVDVR